MTNRPNGWEERRIDEWGGVRGGRQRSPRMSGTPRPYLRVANVFDGRIESTDVLSMPFTDREFATFRLEPGDILLNEGQSIDLVGRSAVYCGAPPDCAFQNTLIRFRPRSPSEASYFVAVFNRLWQSGRFAAIASRTTSIAHLGSGRFGGIRVVCPSLTVEREAIACRLQLFGERQEALTKVIRAKRQLKRGLAEQLLTGALRFEGFKKRSRWLKQKLGDVFGERTESGRVDLPLLSITAGRGVVPRGELDRRDTSPPDKAAYLRIALGDIGYNTMRMWQGVSARSDLEGIVSPAYTVCVPGAGIDSRFAAHLFKLPALVAVFRRHSQGLVNDTLSLKFHHFAQIHVNIPDNDEQAAITSVLDALEREVSLLERLQDAYESERRAVADLLLTGGVRVPA